MDSDDDDLIFVGSSQVAPFEPPPDPHRIVLDLDPLEAHRQQQKKDRFVPLWKQEVTDEKGRRRLHGAFTGGFSAGYYNTVGSEEGWTPSAFVSSRSVGASGGGGGPQAKEAPSKSSSAANKAKREQRPEDFMDDEDLAEIRDREIVRSKVFRASSDDKDRHGWAAAQEPPRSSGARGTRGPAGVPAVPSISAAERLLLHTLTAPSDPIGIQLLRLMGWRPGQGIGARRKKKSMSSDMHAAQYLFAPENTEVIRMDQRPAGEFHGLGFRETKQSLAKLQSTMPSKSAASKTSSLPRGSAFGYGALEEEDEDDHDIYGMDSRMQYDMEQRDEGEEEEAVVKPAPSHRPTSGPTKSSDGRPVLKGFALASRPLMSIQWYDGPKVPSDFVPKHYFLKSASTTKDGAPVVKATSALERGQLLGEKPLPDVAPKSLNSNGADTGNGADADQYGEPASWPTLEVPLAKAALGGFMPFGSDTEKQKRYRAFLGYHAKATSMEAYTTMTERFSQRDRYIEWNEFVKCASIFKPLLGSMANRFTSGEALQMGDVKGGITDAKDLPQIPSAADAQVEKKIWKSIRTTAAFIPSSLLCKRLNIANPYPDGVDLESLTADRTLLSKKTMDKLLSERNDSGARGAPGSSKKTEAEGPSSLDPTHSVAERMIVQREKEAVPERPAMDLFTAIFQNASDSSSESEPEEQEEEPSFRFNKEPARRDIPPPKAAATAAAPRVYGVAMPPPEALLATSPVTAPIRQEPPAEEVMDMWVEKSVVTSTAETSVVSSSKDRGDRHNHHKHSKEKPSSKRKHHKHRSKKEKRKRKRSGDREDSSSDSDSEAEDRERDRKRHHRKSRSKSRDRRRPSSRSRDRRRSRSRDRHTTTATTTMTTTTTAKTTRHEERPRHQRQERPDESRTRPSAADFF